MSRGEEKCQNDAPRPLNSSVLMPVYFQPALAHPQIRGAGFAAIRPGKLAPGGRKMAIAGQILDRGNHKDVILTRALRGVWWGDGGDLLRVGFLCNFCPMGIF